jgi:hypothetical protein
LAGEGAVQSLPPVLLHHLHPGPIERREFTLLSERINP